MSSLGCLCQDKTTWLRFFKDASIPAEFVGVYATKFAENRIRFDMLGDLDRALLSEMGISAIGDSLSILKHAKIIMQKVRHEQYTRNIDFVTVPFRVRLYCASTVLYRNRT